MRRLISEREFTLLQETVRRTISTPATILDAPTGTGRFIPLLRSLGHRVTGIDISPDMLREQRLRGRNHGEALVRGDCERLPFDDASFDYVISFRFMGHLPPPTRLRVLREFRRVARKGVIVEYPVLNSLTRLKSTLSAARGCWKLSQPKPWWPATPYSLKSELMQGELALTHTQRLFGPFSQLTILCLEPLWARPGAGVFEGGPIA